MPGIQPTVETVVWLLAMPMAGSRSQLASTLSTLISGSPIPMKTTFVTRSLRRKCRAWSRISDAVRLRPNFIMPVAQNVQVSGQPDWLDTHSERRPARERIRTGSTGRPAAGRSRAAAEGGAVGGVEDRFLRAGGGGPLVDEPQRRERHLAREPLAQL